jgi:hypothetical protein
MYITLDDKQREIANKWSHLLGEYVSGENNQL